MGTFTQGGGGAGAWGRAAAAAGGGDPTWTTARVTVKTPLRRSFSEHVKDSTNKAWDVLWKSAREKRLGGEWKPSASPARAAVEEVMAGWLAGWLAGRGVCGQDRKSVV